MRRVLDGGADTRAGPQDYEGWPGRVTCMPQHEIGEMTSIMAATCNRNRRSWRPGSTQVRSYGVAGGEAESLQASRSTVQGPPAGYPRFHQEQRDNGGRGTLAELAPGSPGIPGSPGSRNKVAALGRSEALATAWEV